MTDQLRVLLEIGPKGKRIVAAAMDWPGLERWGRTEHDAVDRLLAYVPRYAPVAERVGLRSEFERGVMPHIVERTPGNTSTDWWGVAHVPSVIEAEPLTDDELERRIGLMQAAWDLLRRRVGTGRRAPHQRPARRRARAGPDRPSRLRVGTTQLVAQSGHS